jgi:quercetin dioxygenase-like cupin family protein
MRKVIKTDFGNEVILVNEKWSVLSEMNFTVGKDFTSNAKFSQVFYIVSGLFRFVIRGTTYEFGLGKSVLIPINEKVFISALSNGQILRLCQTYYVEDLSGGSR